MSIATGHCECCIVLVEVGSPWAVVNVKRFRDILPLCVNKREHFHHTTHTTDLEASTLRALSVHSRLVIVYQNAVIPTSRCFNSKLSAITALKIQSTAAL